MRKCFYFFGVIVLTPTLLSLPAFADVSVSSPSSGAVAGSPVHFVASASTNTCSSGVASMGVYVDYALVYVVNGTNLDTSISIGSGSHYTVVEEWDYCGGATFTTVPLTVTGSAGVWATSPTNGSSVSSPVNYAATSNSSCPRGIAAMGVYVDNNLIYTQPGAQLNADLPVGSGTHNTTIEEWDYCGGATYQTMNINVTGNSGNTISDIQKSPWIGWGEYPPAYNICNPCGGWVTWGWNYGIGWPSLSGSATRFDLGGTAPYSDALFVNRVIGQGATLVPDSSQTVLPNVHNFVYDVDFFSASLNVAEVLEFDIAMYLNGKSFTWGNQCRIINGNSWDIWDNINQAWVSANVPCNPVNNGWNHVTINMQRTWDDQLLFHSITLNGNTAVIDRYFSPTSAPWGWYGATLNFQMDGNYNQTPYSVYLDNLTLRYW
jgi:hypothetical protein